MARYDYARPSSVKEAIGIMKAHGAGAVLVAGGTDVMVAIGRKKLGPEVLVSLKGVPGLDGIGEDGAGLEMGALCTHRRIAGSGVIRERFSALHDAASRIGSQQIRNVATIGGNIANGLPSADSACPLFVLDAKVRIATAEGERVLSIGDFYKGPGKTALAHDEVVTGFVIPAPPPHFASCYVKVARRNAMELAMLGIAVALAVEVVDGAPLVAALSAGEPLEGLYEALDRSEIRCREGRIALGVAGPTPMRVKEAEGLLSGARLTGALLTKAGEKAAEEARPRDSVRGAAWYRKEMVRVMPRRLAVACLERVLFPGREAGAPK